MNFDNAMTAADLIDILECCAANTHTSLDEMRIVSTDGSGFAHWIDGYETIEVKEGWITIINVAK